MVKLKKIEEMVHKELIENPITRTSDMALILSIFKKTGIDTQKPFAELALSGELSQMASIKRARRKVQEKHPELKEAETAAARAEAEQDFREFAKL